MNNIHQKKMRGVLKLLMDYMSRHKASAIFYIGFGLFWAFSLPYMSYLFGIIIDKIKTQGLNTVSVYQLILVPLCLYVSIHILRSFGYFVNNLFSFDKSPTL